MKKLFCVVFVLVCLLLMYVTSDSSALNQSSINQAEAEAIEYTDSSYQVEYLSDGRQIKAKEFQLTYDPHTLIVYYKNGGHYLPYISTNGGYYKYQNGKLNEIVVW